MDEIKELERKAQEAHTASVKAQQALENARAKAAAARMEPLKALVVRAHKCLCPWNHTDGCSWGYEEDSTDEWQGQAHDRWLRHYDELVNGSRYGKAQVTVSELETMIATVEGLQPKVRTALWLIRQGKLSP